MGNEGIVNGWTLSSIGTCSLAVDSVCSSLDTLVYDYPFFPRGNGPLVSIILPTRRPVNLCDAVGSLYCQAYDKSNLEFIFKVDDDDQDTIDVVNNISSAIPNCKVIVSPRGKGYLDFHLWVNEMCSIASGDWLFLMNDDAKMLTPNWDRILEGVRSWECWPGVNEVCLLTFSGVRSPGSIAVHLLRRQTYELLGHFSLSPLCDDWIFRVMNCCGYHMHASQIYVDHYGMDDELTRGNHKFGCHALCTISSPKMVKSLAEDVVKIADRSCWFESRREWNPTPNGYRGWMMWKSSLDDVSSEVVLVEDEGRVWRFKGSEVEKVVSVDDMSGFWTVKE